ncbi:MAG: S8 family serine peptidase, partial [Clostridia bacterium]|nr:S8 family serine peptidase [Clostridia bacterium]
MSKINSLKKCIVGVVLLSIIMLAISINFVLPSTTTQRDFDSFAKQVTSIIDRYPVEPNQATFDIDSDVLLSNNHYYVNIDKYMSLTGDTVSMRDDCVDISHQDLSFSIFDDSALFSSDMSTMPSAPLYRDGYVSIDAISNNLGYTYQVNADTITLSRPFVTARLILTSTEPLANTFGAVAVASGYQDMYILQYHDEQDAKDAYSQFTTIDSITSVEPDAIMFAEDIEASVDGLGTAYTSWGAQSVGVDEYSEYLLDTVGSTNLKPTVVAVLDTGIDTDHPFFAGRITGGANFVSTANSYEDDHGHGTHVAGIVCDLTTGLNNIQIMPIKVLQAEGYGYTSSILLGIEYAINQKQNNNINICALNLSFGGQYPSASTEKTQYEQHIISAYNAGIFSVVSSGNDGNDISTYLPSNIEKAITVSAVGKSNSTYYCPTWSNFGENVDISAPGASIRSARMGG